MHGRRRGSDVELMGQVTGGVLLDEQAQHLRPGAAEQDRQRVVGREHADPIVNEVKVQVLQTNPDGTVKSESATGGLVYRVHNLGTARPSTSTLVGPR